MSDQVKERDYPASKYSVLVFGTLGCGHCKSLFQSLEVFYTRHRGFSLSYMDYFENQQLAEMLGIGRMVPYSVILRDGAIVQGFSGNQAEGIQDALTALLNPSSA